MQRRTRCLIVILLLVLPLVHCSGGGAEQAATSSPEAAAEQSSGLYGELTIDGSTTMEPLVEKLAAAFLNQHPQVELDIQSTDSGAGIQAVQQGSIDIGMTSRGLTEEEQTAGITIQPIAVDMVAVIVHPSNPVTNLTRAQLRDIFAGHIVNWGELGGEDMEVVPIIREERSGTRATFDTVVMEGQEHTVDAELQFSTSLVEIEVANISNAIGYVSFGHVDPKKVSTIAIDGIYPDHETAMDGSYPLQRPLLLLTGPLSRDLSGEFIDFALSDAGQQIVQQEGWIPVQQAGS